MMTSGLRDMGDSSIKYLLGIDLFRERGLRAF
jgi:hypothetical protein